MAEIINNIINYCASVASWHGDRIHIYTTIKASIKMLNKFFNIKGGQIKLNDDLEYFEVHKKDYKDVYEYIEKENADLPTNQEIDEDKLTFLTVDFEAMQREEEKTITDEEINEYFLYFEKFILTGFLSYVEDVNDIKNRFLDYCLNLMLKDSSLSYLDLFPRKFLNLLIPHLSTALGRNRKSIFSYATYIYTDNLNDYNNRILKGYYKIIEDLINWRLTDKNFSEFINSICSKYSKEYVIFVLYYALAEIENHNFTTLIDIYGFSVILFYVLCVILNADYNKIISKDNYARPYTKITPIGIMSFKDRIPELDFNSMHSYEFNDCGKMTDAHENEDSYDYLSDDSDIDIIETININILNDYLNKSFEELQPYLHDLKEKYDNIHFINPYTELAYTSYIDIHDFESLSIILYILNYLIITDNKQAFTQFILSNSKFIISCLEIDGSTESFKTIKHNIRSIRNFGLYIPIEYYRKCEDISKDLAKVIACYAFNTDILLNYILTNSEEKDNGTLKYVLFNRVMSHLVPF